MLGYALMLLVTARELEGEAQHSLWFVKRLRLMDAKACPLRRLT